MSETAAEKQENKFEGFVLTGGKSSRMGRNKALLNIGSETFLERAVKNLSSICSGHIRIVLNQNQSVSEFPSFEYVRDIFPERGALGGIHTALVHSTSAWVLILACDLPLVESKTLIELSQIALNSPDKIAAVVPRQQGGKVQPLCAFYRSSLCLAPLENLLRSQNSVSVRDFLKTVETIYVEEKTSIDKKSVFFNVNTPADYDLLSDK